MPGANRHTFRVMRGISPIVLQEGILPEVCQSGVQQRGSSNNQSSNSMSSRGATKKAQEVFEENVMSAQNMTPSSSFLASGLSPYEVIYELRNVWDSIQVLHRLDER